jgi:hypothetical protein
MFIIKYGIFRTQSTSVQVPAHNIRSWRASPSLIIIKFCYLTLNLLPLQYSRAMRILLHTPPTLGVLVADRYNVLGRQTGLWSTEAKVWGIVPKAAWYWGGDSSVANNPSGHRTAPRRIMPSTRMKELCGWRVFNSPVLVGLIWTRNLQEKNMAKAIKGDQ